MRFNPIVLGFLLILPLNVRADVISRSCEFYRASEHHELDSVVKISALHVGDIVKICEAINQPTDYFVLSKIDGGPVGLCHFTERRIFKSFQEPRWNLIPPRDEDYLANLVDLVLSSREPCPSPSSAPYVRVAGMSPTHVLRFLNFWNGLLSDGILLRSEFDSVATDQGGEKLYQEFLSKMKESSVREIKLESLGFNREEKSRYEAIVKIKENRWILIFTERGDHFAVNDIHSIIE